MSSGLTIEKDGRMHCDCPCCGEEVPVYEEYRHLRLHTGEAEYLVRCDDCGQFFYTSNGY